MELEDLRSTWRSVKTQISETDRKGTAHTEFRYKTDRKARLLARVLFGVIFAMICLVLLATSHLWSPTKIPAIWLVAFCAVIFAGVVCDIRIYYMIRSINLWDDTNTRVLSAVIGIKRLYRNTELAVSILVILLLVWLSFTPPFDNVPDRIIISGLTIVCFIAEFLWYRSNIRQLNRLSNWEKE